jgi:GNAT superfamily N-acetyltransferase
MEPVEIVQADLDDADHQRAVVALTDAYARDPMGNGAPLPQEKLDRLIDGLRNHPTTVILLAYAGGQAVGIATCFLGYSTFAVEPLLNVHDLAVLPGHRGLRIGAKLLEAVEQKARQLGCSKLTLEVGDTNARAKDLYEKAGFAQPTSEGAGDLLFYAKPLT